MSIDMCNPKKKQLKARKKRFTLFSVRYENLNYIVFVKLTFDMTSVKNVY